MRVRICVLLMGVAACLDPPARLTDGGPGVSGDGGDGGDGGGGADAAGVVSNGLVAWYPMDDDPKDGADEVRGRHPGTCAVCPVAVEGRFDGAYDFMEGAHLRVADAEELHLAEGTVSLWFKVMDGNAPGMFVSKPYGPADGNSFALFMNSGQIRFQLGPNGAVVSSVGVSAGSWVHLVAVWTPEERRLYQDSVLAATEVEIGAPSYDQHELLIGIEEDGEELDLPLDGALDDLQIFDRALSEEEIELLSDAG